MLFKKKQSDFALAWNSSQGLKLKLSAVRAASVPNTFLSKGHMHCWSILNLSWFRTTSGSFGLNYGKNGSCICPDKDLRGEFHNGTGRSCSAWVQVPPRGQIWGSAEHGSLVVLTKAKAAAALLPFICSVALASLHFRFISKESLIMPLVLLYNFKTFCMYWMVHTFSVK